MMKKKTAEKKVDSFKRRPRKRKLNGAWLAVLRGLLASIASCVILVAAFALLLTVWRPQDNVITTINQMIKFASILLGVYVCVGRGGAKGALRGACIGALYMAIGVSLYALLSQQQLPLTAYAADLGMGVAAGGLFGMILSNLAAK